MMEYLRKYDRWVITKTESVLQFLLDWLGITQKSVEISMIVFQVLGRTLFITCYGKGNMAPSLMEAMIAIYLIRFMTVLHKDASAVRKKLVSSIDGVFIRTMWQALMIMGLSLPRGLFIDTGAFLSSGSMVVFLYVIVCNIDGERGRKSKMAWSKIKELFGTSWIPEPVGDRP